jgi:hypothetical protein
MVESESESKAERAGRTVMECLCCFRLVSSRRYLTVRYERRERKEKSQQCHVIMVIRAVV